MNDAKKADKSFNQLDFSYNQSEKNEILNQSIFTPLKMNDSIDDSSANKTIGGDQIQQIPAMVDQQIEDDGGTTKHKKHKKDKKHKKERHEKSEKKNINQEKPSRRI